MTLRADSLLVFLVSSAKVGEEIETCNIDATEVGGSEVAENVGLVLGHKVCLKNVQDGPVHALLAAQVLVQVDRACGMVVGMVRVVVSVSSVGLDCTGVKINRPNARRGQPLDVRGDGGGLGGK